jgi:hypothetical protein
LDSWINFRLKILDRKVILLQVPDTHKKFWDYCWAERTRAMTRNHDIIIPSAFRGLT